MSALPSGDPQFAPFLNGKSAHTIELFDHFVEVFQSLGPVTLHPAKTMIGIAGDTKRIAWITQLGKQFIHVVFPFEQPYEENLCFQKIAHHREGDAKQFNHHFRMLSTEDVNAEVRWFMQKALDAV